ncbi:hypothetical protein PSSHI_30950 [Photobacterium sp. R1]
MVVGRKQQPWLYLRIGDLPQQIMGWFGARPADTLTIGQAACHEHTGIAVFVEFFAVGQQDKASLTAELRLRMTNTIVTKAAAGTGVW